MSLKNLENLRKVTQVLYAQEHVKIAEVLAQEASIRAAMARLESQNQAGLTDEDTVDPMQLIGADLLWNTWQHQTRQRLNTELAQVMARKLQLLDRVRRAFGKDQAIQTLAREGAADLAAHQAKRDQARALGWT